jgi:hypothetical protein
LVGCSLDGLYNAIIMDFGVKRLHTSQETGRRYHLFDGKGKLVLVADHGSPWLPTDSYRQVRFARSGGQVVAIFDLPEGAAQLKNGRFHTSYALIRDHAVYAIINELQEEGGDTPPYFTIEADGQECLLWRWRQDPLSFNLYAEIPSNLTIFDDPLEFEMLAAIGQIQQTDGRYDFTITLPSRQFRHLALILLALVFLLDRAAD